MTKRTVLNNLPAQRSPRADDTSLPASLHRHAHDSPGRVALVFLPDGEGPGQPLTYAELDRQARAFAARLRARGLSGSTVMLMLPSGPAYVAAFFGCLYVGAIAVPAYPPANARHSSRLRHIAQDCGAQAAVVAPGAGREPGSLLEGLLPHGFIAFDGADLPSAQAIAAPAEASPSDPAYLQYTSGSTCEPRGVVVTHGNLADHCRVWNSGVGVCAEDVFVTWLPLFHDMGLVMGVAQAVFAGARTVMMPPMAFLQKPARWLAAIGRHRGTISYAPNFAYELCASSRDEEAFDRLDLSSWSVAGNGAEPVRADTLERFARRFGKSGFRAEAMNPSYGLAEATLCVTFHARLQAPVTMDVDAEALGQGRHVPARPGARRAILVDCGSAWGDTVAPVVDPATRSRCADGFVGEVWVRGSAVAAGYWRRGEETAEVFQAHLADGEGPFLRTGDLGLWHGGRLFIAGRLKDVIVVRGQNHHPQDIEHTVSACDEAFEAMRGAAFAVEVDGEERLVVAQEVRRSLRRQADLPALALAVRAAVAEAHGLRVHAVHLLKPASVPVTSSGKVQRQACKRALAEGTLQALFVWRDEPVPVPADAEPIAVVGMACRFPKAGSVDAYWRLLDTGADAITEVPAERWPAGEDGAAALPPETRSCTRWGGFIDGIDRFDAAFFGISPREAQGMDPQQRMLLQATWHALEDAGIAPDTLAGGDAGVFVGAMTHDYEALELAQGCGPDAHFGTGVQASILANRISYWLDLHGPSWTVQTACSSGLVALHNARASLQRGECGLAIVGGANALLSPELFVALAQARMLSPDGRCMSFDERANGYVRSEGCAVLVLKRLADARRDNDRIHGIVGACAVNQDGRGNGLTAPNAQAQQQVMRRALAEAGWPPGSVGYVEAHGTGTPVGDPVEMEALRQVYGEPSDEQPVAWVGSAKSNIGHTEPVSGLAGIVKVLLAMRHERIPGNLHLRRLNPRIVLEGSRCAVMGQAQPWPRGARPRRAAVSAFGFGGTNAHVLLQEPPEPTVPAALSDSAPDDAAAELLTLSARTAPALRARAADMAEHLLRSGEAPLRDICFTANARRAHGPHRLALVGGGREELAAALSEWTARQTSMPAGAVGTFGPAPKAAGRTAFLFTGQGSQYAGMGRALYRHHALFRAVIDRCDAILRPLLAVPLADLLYGEGGEALLAQTRFAQPALFAVEYALAQVWRSCGVQPDVVMGHSLGEYVAACVAGVFTLEDGLTLVAHRGRLMQAQTPPGAMASFHAAPRTLDRLLEELAGPGWPDLALAARNTSGDAVVSGDPSALDRFARRWTDSGAVVTPLQVDRAFHSPLMAGMLVDFERVARRVPYALPALTWVSNMDGAVAGEASTDPAFWVEHVSRPVDFLAGLRRLEQLGCSRFVEVGPHPVLTAFGRQAGIEGDWLASQRRGSEADRQLLEALGEWYRLGLPVDWHGEARARLGPAVPLPRPVSLPHYPFQAERHWFKSAAVVPGRQGASAHPLLGRRAERVDAGSQAFVGTLSAAGFAFIEQHRVFGEPLLPMAAMVEAALAAARLTSAGNSPEWSVDRFSVRRGLGFPGDGQAVALRTVSTQDRGGLEVRLSTRPLGDADSDWRELATCRVRPSFEVDGRQRIDLAALRERLPELAVDGFYERAARLGLAYGPALQGLRRLWLQGDEALARMEMPAPPPGEGDPYLLHPAMLDACLHVALPFIERQLGDEGGALLPVSIERLTVHRRLPARAWAHGRWLGRGADGRWQASLDVVDDEGGRILSLRGIQLAQGSAAGLAQAQAQDDLPSHYRIRWDPVDDAEPQGTARPAGLWLVLCRDARQLRALSAQCEESGGQVIGVAHGTAGSPVFGAGMERGRPLLLDWDSEDDWAGFFAGLAEQGAPVRGVWFHGDSRGTAPHGEEGDPVRLADEAGALARACFLALKHCLRTQGDAGFDTVLCTRGATSPDAAVQTGERMGEDGLTQAGLVGLAKAVAMERPHAKCVLFDLDPAEPGVPWAEAIARVGRSQGSAMFARRGGRLFEGRLAAQHPERWLRRPQPVSARGTYLVTGGMRGLGLAAAKALVEDGARHLALLGRTVPAEAGAAIEEMKALGARVMLVQADVADAADLARALLGIQEALPPLRGVVHAAGLTEDALLTRMDAAAFSRVLAPKIQGAWNLHRSTESLDLDFFMLFSSSVSLHGNAGQANYIAACAFLDGLAAYRAQRGQPATAVNWGYWSETGLAANAGMARYMERRGVHGIGTAQGVRVFRHLVAASAVQAGPAAIDWAVFKRVMCPGLPCGWLEGLADAPDSSGAHQPQAVPEAAPSLPPAQAIAGLHASAAKALLLERLLSIAGRVLHLGGSRLGELAHGFVSMPLNQLGFDSLMSVEMNKRIRDEFGVSVPLPHFMTGLTAGETVDLIHRQLMVNELRLPEGGQDAGSEQEEVLL